MAAVWVVIASKYGATREIGGAIADELEKAAHQTELKDAEA